MESLSARNLCSVLPPIFHQSPSSEASGSGTSTGGASASNAASQAAGIKRALGSVNSPQDPRRTKAGAVSRFAEFEFFLKICHVCLTNFVI